MIDLNSLSTRPPVTVDKSDCKDKTNAYIHELDELQNRLFAENKHSLLIVLQGMDASGKDGVIREVFSGVNPMGCRIQAFKKPTEIEMGHEFLWRVHQHAPQKGMIQIFNRSHYEDVVIQRVHKWVDADTIKRRYEHINAFERLLLENNTHILKFYLHVSQQEQHDRLAERLQMREKMWKYNANDLKESERWPEYMEAYQDAFNACGPDIPWHIIPSDKNWYKEFLVAETIVRLLRSLNMEYPGLPAS
jgi:PPK2 family polyphosphate:nucleotide phosphotransferase